MSTPSAADAAAHEIAHESAHEGVARAVIGAPILAEDLAAMRWLVPDSVSELVDDVGAAASLALINAWPGVAIVMPRASDAGGSVGARLWQALAALIGEEATQRMGQLYGGQCVEIASCFALRTERRRRWLRARCDAMFAAAPGVSKATALHALGIALARAGDPMSGRAIEMALDSGDADPAQLPATACASAQPDLFPEPDAAA